ncbi:S1 RNA-binding domain-containing protein, partial [Streptomyces sp. F001]|uniref:S1 RNA-binding domain-containing protein n=1 Tax=Streptomyces sp. F001 TaxID=1510026 RepID=UPI00101E4DC6
LHEEAVDLPRRYWMEFARNRLGRVVRGTVTKAVPFGGFVRVAEGVEGLVHRDTLTGPSLPEVGDELSVEIVGINLVRRRVGLKPAS